MKNLANPDVNNITAANRFKVQMANAAVSTTSDLMNKATKVKTTNSAMSKSTGINMYAEDIMQEAFGKEFSNITYISPGQLRKMFMPMVNSETSLENLNMAVQQIQGVSAEDYKPLDFSKEHDKQAIAENLLTQLTSLLDVNNAINNPELLKNIQTTL